MGRVITESYAREPRSKYRLASDGAVEETASGRETRRSRVSLAALKQLMVVAFLPQGEFAGTRVIG